MMVPEEKELSFDHNINLEDLFKKSEQNQGKQYIKG